MANNIIKQAILLGMGSVYYSKEKIEELFQELSENQKINPEEGKKMIKDIVDKAQIYRLEQEKQLNKVISKIVKDLGVATKQDIQDLKNEFRSNSKVSNTPVSSKKTTSTKSVKKTK